MLSYSFSLSPVITFYVFRYSKTGDNRPFYSTYQKQQDGSENIVFTSPSILSAMGRDSVIYMDATFRSMPTQPKFKLLLIAHVAAFNYVCFVGYNYCTDIYA